MNLYFLLKVGEKVRLYSGLHMFRLSSRQFLNDMIRKEGKTEDALIRKLLAWRHNPGFSVHNGVRLERSDEAGREALPSTSP